MKLVQREAFNDEIHRLQGKQSISPKSSIHNLDPYIDSNGILRVGGRIQRAAITDDEKHPIILPAKIHLTTLLIRRTHDQTLHGGYGLVARKLRQKYWIVTGSNAIKSEIHITQMRHLFQIQEEVANTKNGGFTKLPIARSNPIHIYGCGLCRILRNKVINTKKCAIH